MYRIVGAVLAVLLMGNGRSRLAALPSFKEIIEVKHFLPGRIRFFIPGLLRKQYDIHAVKAQLLAVKGISRVEISTVSGSVTVFYLKEVLEPMLVFAILVKLFQLEKDLEKIPQPVLAREMQHFDEALNRSVYENTGGFTDLRTAVPIALAVLGAYKLLFRKEPALPGGVTLLWWAYTSLLSGGNKLK